MLYKSKSILLLVEIIIISLFISRIFVLNIYAESENTEPVGVYGVQDFPYKKSSSAKKCLDKMKDIDNFVYVEEEFHMLSNKVTFKQANNPSQYIYYGKIKKGHPDGYGVILKEHYGYYIVDQMGKFKNGGLNGYGYQFKLGAVCFINSEGEDSLFLSYEGEFKNGVYNGSGISYVYSNTLDSQILEYEKYLRLVDGNTYKTVSGKEIMLQFLVSVSKKMYEGKYKKGLRNGKGISYGYSGLVEYKGNYKNGKKNGRGKEYYEGTTTLKYEGSYKNDLYHGKGKLYMENGDLKYKGKFKKGNYE